MPPRASPLGGALRLGLAVGGAAARPVARFAGRSLARGTRAALDAALDSGLVDDALASPVVDRLTQHVVDSASMERLVVRVIDSRLVDAAVARLLESEDLWIVVDEVARSPSVTEAIGQQGVSFAGQVTDAVRTRSLRADERLERAARRLFGRRAAPAGPPAEPGAAPS
ncbi:MAG: hypothetical protein ACJ77Z_05400 [Thermoleophilaceae bacterium]